jgi:hypothetical protein
MPGCVRPGWGLCPGQALPWNGRGATTAQPVTLDDAADDERPFRPSAGTLGPELHLGHVQVENLDPTGGARWRAVQDARSQ